MLKKTLKLSGILFAIAFVTALLLSVTNELTADIIAQRKLDTKNKAMAQVIKAESFTLLKSADGDFEFYSATNGDTPVGYVVSLSESGYGGNIDMIIGIAKDGSISGVSILEMSETAGLGDNVKKPEFTDMFKGLEEDEVALTLEGGKIHALTGATVTSKAVTNGAHRALEIFAQQVDGGGLDNE